MNHAAASISRTVAASSLAPNNGVPGSMRTPSESDPAITASNPKDSTNAAVAARASASSPAIAMALRPAVSGGPARLVQVVIAHVVERFHHPGIRQERLYQGA